MNTCLFLFLGGGGLSNLIMLFYRFTAWYPFKAFDELDFVVGESYETYDLVREKERRDYRRRL